MDPATIERLQRYLDALNLAKTDYETLEREVINESENLQILELRYRDAMETLRNDKNNQEKKKKQKNTRNKQ